MKKTKHILLTAMLFISCSLFAQQSTISNILNIKYLKQSGVIVENEKLAGYFMFYFKEKEDRKTSNYELEIYDDNYNSVGSFNITRPKNTYLMETVYNGEVFMLFFYDTKTGFEFATYNRKGEEIGNTKTPRKQISQYQIAVAAQGIAGDGNTIFAMGNKGFIRQSVIKNKKVGYQLTAYDNELNVLWEQSSPKTSALLESININEVTDDIITTTVYRKKSAMTKKMDLAFYIVDSKDGKLITEVEMGNASKGKSSLLKTYFDKTSNKIILIGEFFKPGDDILKDKSQGLFIKEISPTGKEIRVKKFLWKGNIDKFKNENLSKEDKEEDKAAFSIYFHDVIRSKNGHLFLIGEQFRKQVSAIGVAGNLLSAASGNVSSNAANFEIRVSNMIVIELDEKNVMLEYKIVRKKRNSVLLPSGAGLWSTAYLGYYVKIIGGFDYSFTSRNSEDDEYTVMYRDLNKKEEKGSKRSDVMLGIIQIGEGKLETSRTPINSDAKWFRIQKAKPGNVSIIEYHKKEKQLEMRLEKIAY